MTKSRTKIFRPNSRCFGRGLNWTPPYYENYPLSTEGFFTLDKATEEESYHSLPSDVEAKKRGGLLSCLCTHLWRDRHFYHIIPEN
jgi:hypothetical protein